MCILGPGLLALMTAGVVCSDEQDALTKKRAMEGFSCSLVFREIHQEPVGAKDYGMLQVCLLTYVIVVKTTHTYI